MIAAVAESAQELPWWLALTLVAIAITMIAGFFGGWSGIWKTWAVVVGLLILGVVLAELEEGSDEHCEYDRFGNSYCMEVPHGQAALRTRSDPAR